VILLSKLIKFHLGEGVHLFSDEVARSSFRDDHAHMVASIGLIAARLAADVHASTKRACRARLTFGTSGDE
jgi:hypothetical protein